MKVGKWVFFSIVLPLAPILLAVLIKIGQEVPVEYYKLLGGMEIYILSVTVFASTLMSSMVFTVVFVNEHVQPLSVSQTFVADLGIGLGIVTVAICIPLQIRRYLANQTQSAE